MTHGVLLLDKPAGISSNAALQRVRRAYGWPKAGHTGTLDPLATGLLPICMGEATKFSHSLLDADKSYEASIRLGFLSSTGDAEGVIEPYANPDFDALHLRTALESFVGTNQQVPPMYSALKKDGRTLYSYARAGETVQREARNIVINSLYLINNNDEILTVSVNCSKGTYIRVLAEDIGKALGCGAYLLKLRRTGIRDLHVADAIGLEELNGMNDEQKSARLLPVDRLVENLPMITLDNEARRRLITGLDVSISDIHGGAGLVRLYDATGLFLGIGERLGAGKLISKRLVSQAEQGECLPRATQLSP